MKHSFHKYLIARSFIFFLILLNTAHIINTVSKPKKINEVTRFNINNQASVIESMTESISTEIGGCTLCDELAIVDSKIDALNTGVLAGPTSIIESLVENINSHIGSCTICDQLTTIETDLSSISSNVTILLSHNACALTPISTPTTITQSGSYCLTSSISGTITINASKVTLDLNENTIIPTGSNNGIVVNASNSYFQIKNGFIIGSGTTSVEGILINNGCTNFVISDIEVWNISNSAGIKTNGASNTNFTIKNCTIGTVGQQGISCSNCSNFILDNCITQNCGSASLSASFNMSNAQSYVIRNSIAQVGGSSGFDMSNSFSGYLDSCTAENCASIGFTFTGGTDITARGCTAQANTTNGFDLTNATKSKITNCTALNNSGVGFNSPATSANNLIQGCTALNNSSYGFSDDGSNFFVNNYALNNTSGNYNGSFINAPLTSKLDTLMNYWKNYDANA